MARLSIVKTSYGKDEAAAIIRKLLESQIRVGPGKDDPAKLANRLVDRVWQEQEALLRCLPEQSPHKMAVAAFALAHGSQWLPESELSLGTATIALGNVLAEIELNESYRLNSLDERLIEAAQSTFAEMLDRFNNPPMASGWASSQPELGPSGADHAANPTSPG